MPAQICRITIPEGFEAIPEFAVLSAMAHVNTPGSLDSAAHALAAAGRLVPVRATLCADLVFSAASPEARKLLESK